MTILESMWEYYPKWKELVAWATKANASTLENLTSAEIAQYFESLLPFRVGKGIVLKDVKMSFWKRGLSVIDSIRIAQKIWAGTAGVQTLYLAFQLTGADLVRFLREYGEKVVPVVRKEIQNEMSRLIELLKQVKEYPYLEMVREFDGIQIMLRDGIEYVKRIEVDNWNPGLIKIVPVTSSNLYANLYNGEHLELLEQIHDQLVEFFSYCYKTVSYTHLKLPTTERV